MGFFALEGSLKLFKCDSQALYQLVSTSLCLLISSNMIFSISASFSSVSASKRRVRFGLVFEARTAPQLRSLNLIRTPSRVMQSYFFVKAFVRAFTISNFLSSGQWALYSGVITVVSRSLN